jgi:DNA-binding transcriptional regulator GbsR (MarR family)
MDPNTLNAQLSSYVEACGLVFERWGLPRTAGRIWGWLHVCDPPRQSAQDLLDALQVSRGSVSTNTRLLESMGLIERIGVPGSRQSYYRLRDDAFEAILSMRIKGAKEVAAITEKGLQVLQSAEPARRRRLEHQRDFYSFMVSELEALLRHWQEHKADEPFDG